MKCLGMLPYTKYMYIKHHKLLHSNIIKKNNTSVKTRTLSLKQFVLLKYTAKLMNKMNIRRPMKNTSSLRKNSLPFLLLS